MRNKYSISGVNSRGWYELRECGVLIAHFRTYGAAFKFTLLK